MSEPGGVLLFKFIGYREKRTIDDGQVNIVRDNVSNGKYDASRGTTPTAYFLGKLCLVRHLKPHCFKKYARLL